MSNTSVSNGAAHCALDLGHAEPHVSNVQQEAPVRPSETADGHKKTFWTPQKILYSLLLFIASGIAEIGGGWLVFQTIRVDRPFWWAIIGSVILVIYGFIPTLQPISNFGRVFAVYGG
jgi:hypothetical protein